jgi:hypothetical protein
MGRDMHWWTGLNTGKVGILGLPTAGWPMFTSLTGVKVSNQLLKGNPGRMCMCAAATYTQWRVAARRHLVAPAV